MVDGKVVVGGGVDGVVGVLAKDPDGPVSLSVLRNALVALILTSVHLATNHILKRESMGQLAIKTD